MDIDFQADISVLQDILVPFEQKKLMLDIIHNEIVPYRYHDGPRLFPDLQFYSTLFYNRADFLEIWPFVNRFHTWISYLAFNSPEMTDEALRRLRTMVPGYAPNMKLSQIFQQPEHNPGPVFPPERPIQVLPQNQNLEDEAPMPHKSASRKKRAPVHRDDDHPLLADELNRPANFSYRGIIRDMEHFEEVDDAYEWHVKRKAGQSPTEDATWPSTTVEQKEHVKTLFDNITNMTNFYELRKATERLSSLLAQQAGEDSGPILVDEEGSSRKRQRTNKAGKQAERLRPSGVNKADWELMNPESSAVDRLAAVVHHPITDIEIEILCWRLLMAAMNAQKGFTMRLLWSGQRTTSTWDFFETFAERWSVICEQLLDCKLLVHSLTRADWISKFASAPHKERASKLSNDLLNGRRDVQNQVGREVIKAKTGAKEWTTTEDFEIRSKDGSVIVKGGQIGDKARRKLAVRGAKQDAESSASPPLTPF
ncbi:uncharacterized protein CTRU02_202775 [Colletotrichum truncatum]|uniref:Uncharacterized protein n=1 Tax=Colletotrichum truncatum TaxID=5467 RepID=A0ACC3ZLA2_COLTU|nr:uncharacterized protein CTRU02_10700 [Colletotrichum truncatum]KAF6787001.1 hypothetical protein CTRU02_10700 [Colletotrichum truncatum]